MKKLATVIVALALFIAAANARAVTFTGTTTTSSKKGGTETLKASATFVISNLELVITVSNTGTSDPRSPADILTGIFFDVAGSPSLTPVSAMVAPDSTVIGQRLPLGFDGNVGGEWAYRDDLTKAPGGDAYGISSTKLGFFKKSDLFPGKKIKGTHPLSGVQFGITTLNDLLANDQGGVKNKGLVQNTIIFVFDNLPSNFTVSDISNVTFQYGTSVKNVKKGLDIAGEMVVQVPEPSTVALVAMGFIGALALVRSRARRR
jgi:hypothetical protein